LLRGSGGVYCEQGAMTQDEEPADTEKQRAIRIANKVLDRPSGDPDDDLAVLSRQLLRALKLI
jgi:hypothetical protein